MQIRFLALAFSLAVALPLNAKIITVNTTNNIAPALGETNLVDAITMLEDGDIIRFNLPGTGPFYLITPDFTQHNGYPSVVANNVLIDGYSQPGAAPNTNPILAPNNARIMVVIDSRAGGRHMEDIPGYSTSEAAALMIKGATNVTVRGLCFLGPGVGSGTDPDPDNYAISYALGADFGHVNGCWFGVDLDRTNVYRFKDAITGFRVSATGPHISGTVIGVEKNATNAAAARAQFNVNVGQYIPIILEGNNYRIAGNFINVFPDGMTDYNVNGVAPYDIEAFMELGRGGDNLVLGTDGDGHNDAEERNIFGGATKVADDNILEWYGGTRTNMIIAGNYFGVAIDGVRRFTNSMKLFGGFNSTTTVRVGSDFDGVSDSLEGNVIAMNYPFNDLFPTPFGMVPPVFGDLSAGARVSLRGNTLIGNNIPPYSYADNTSSHVQSLTNFFLSYLTLDQLIPGVSTNSSIAVLSGTCDQGLDPYTNVVIDVYIADPEGWTNGQKFQLTELLYNDPVTGNQSAYGFAQGKTYLGSFLENGPLDLDRTPGSFRFNIAGFNLPAGTPITVTANYSADPPGTPNGRTQTSLFSQPFPLISVPRVSATRGPGNTIILSWPVTDGLFTIQSNSVPSSVSWVPLLPQPPVTTSGGSYRAQFPLGSGSAFFRLAR